MATPARALRTESILRHQTLSQSTIERAIEALGDDFSPIDDHRGSVVQGHRRSELIAFFWKAGAGECNSLDRPTGTIFAETN